MTGADQAQVQGPRSTAAEGDHLALFQHPEQAGLQRQRHVADLVEKEDAAIGLLQLAGHAFLARPGETAAAIAEQLAFDQRLRDGRAIEGDESLAGATAGAVQGAGEGFLAGAGLAVQQHWHVALQDLERPAEIPRQGRIGQADAAGQGRLGHRHWGDRPYLGTAHQAVEALALAATQRPAGAGLRTGALQQVVLPQLEQALHPLPQHRATRQAQQHQGGLVGGLDATLGVEGQQPFAEQADIGRLGMEAQQIAVGVAVEEVAALDQLGREIDQRHGMELTLARGFLAGGGDVQHRQQFAGRIEDRTGRAGQLGMPTAEVFVAVDGQRLALHHAGADAIGALAGLAPVGAQPQPGLLEGLALGLGGDAIEDQPAGIGEQHGMAGAAQLLVQGIHLTTGDLQDPLLALAVLVEAGALQHPGRYRSGRVELVFVETAPPGAGDGRIAGRAVKDGAASEFEHLAGMTIGRGGGHCCCPPRGVCAAPSIGQIGRTGHSVTPR